jgi:hypothetical protein
MNRIRFWIQQLRQELSRRRQRLSLTIGLRRLHRWKSRLQRILLALRPPMPLLGHQAPSPAMQALRLPKELTLALPTLLWALEMLEDLYLLLETVEIQMVEAISATSQPL